MTYQEKLEIENRNHDSIILWKSTGLFYEAINFSAFAFHKTISPYKVMTVRYKSIKEPLLVLGCPRNKLPELAKQFCLEIVDHGNYICLPINSPLIYISSYLEWRNDMLSLDNGTGRLQEDQTNNTKKDLTLADNCISKLQDCNVQNISPLEAILVLNELITMARKVRLPLGKVDYQ